MRLFKALIVYILHTIVNTHGSEKHSHCICQFLRNEPHWNEKGLRTAKVTSCRLATRERQVRGGWCLPSSGPELAGLTGPGTRKEVLSPNMKTKTSLS